MKKSFSSVRFFTLLFIFALLLSALSAILSFNASAADIPDLSHAEAVYLYNYESKSLLIDKDTTKRIFPGAAAKTLTALIAFDTLWDNPQRSVTITKELLEGAEGASMKLKAGMTVRVEDLMYGLICGGGNDAALVLSRLCASNDGEFVSLMNSYASELGALDTHFTNPTGLDDTAMYSTLSDIAIFCNAARENSDYMEISNTRSYVYTPEGSGEEIKIFNRNSLVSTYYAEGYQSSAADGIIAGVTDLGGYFAAAYAELSGESYLCIVSGGDSDEENIYSYKIINDLLRFAASEYSYEKIASAGTFICNIPVENSMESTEDGSLPLFDCVLKDDIYALTYASSDSEITLKYYLFEDVIKAPREAGYVVGGVDYFRGEELVATSPLVLSDDVEENGFVAFLSAMKSFFLSRFFIVSLLSFCVLFFIYYYHAELKHRRKKVKKLKYRNYY